jgi:pyruvate dehydrogenase E1 component alpha subunit
MPRSVIELPHQVEYLSILDDDGNIDKELDPGLPEDLLVKIQRAMLLSRRLDDAFLGSAIHILRHGKK